jgi:hypothetical protein
MQHELTAAVLELLTFHTTDLRRDSAIGGDALPYYRPHGSLMSYRITAFRLCSLFFEHE